MQVRDEVDLRLRVANRHTGAEGPVICLIRVSLMTRE
jgi:hypothetical protein